MKNLLKRINAYVPTASKIVVAIALFAVCVNITYVLSVPFADWFNANVSSYLRIALAYLTSWIPFSLAEFILISLPLLAAALIVWAIRYASRVEHGLSRAVSVILTIPLALYSAFVFDFGAGYRTTPLDERMGLDEHEVTAEELYETLNIVIEQINALEDEISYADWCGSISPLSHAEVVAECTKSYDLLVAEYDFIRSFSVPVKRIVLSPIMTYTHISGVYTFFTGEANLNTNFPDFINVFTTAHEMAHQRGIARENEANFTAYLVCINSDNPYMRYSGFMNMYEYLSSALYKASPSLYAKASVRLCRGGKFELQCYSEFFDRYRDNFAADVSDAVNDSYLTAQGTEGARSYGLVVDLAVAYHSAEEDN